MTEAGFGGRLRKARLSRWLSQTELAKLACLDPSAISQLESGRRRPSLKNFCTLCNVLRISADELLRKDG